MPIDASSVRSNYVTGVQDAAKLLLQAKSTLDSLSLMYLGSGLSGTFQDAELAATPVHKHMDAQFIGTVTTNLATIITALTPAICQNLAKAVGKPV